MKKIFLILIILIVLGGISYLIFGSLNGNIIKENSSNQEDVKTFNVDAFKYGYSPDKIEVNLGDRVKIIINNTDVLHGIRIPDFNVRGNEVIEFTANKTGEFDWFCTNFCGDKHKEMGGKLIIK